MASSPSIEPMHSLWIGGALAPMQQLSIRSFLAQGHPFHLFVYDEVEGVPPGTTLRDATTLLPRDAIFTYQHGFGKGSFSAFSNLFRYRLLWERGGWWVDTDVVCVAPLRFDDDIVIASETQEDGSVVTASCVMRSPAGASFLEHCVRVSEASNKAELQWSQIGPRLLGDAVQRFGLESHRVAPEVFNPVHWFAYGEITAPGFDLERIRDSCTVHLWNQMWRHHERDPAAEAAGDSLYAHLVRLAAGSR